MGEQMNATEDWFSLKWFTSGVLQNFEWENSLVLYGFYALPLLIKHLSG